MTVKAYGAHAGTLPLEPMDITRRAPGAHDVQISTRYALNGLERSIPAYRDMKLSVVSWPLAITSPVFVQGTWWGSAALSTAAGTAVTVTTDWRTTATI